MNTIDLRNLYDATATDLRFGIGLLAMPDRGHAPYIHIHQPGWTREMLGIVRASFWDGLVLVSRKGTAGTVDLHLATRQRVAIQANKGGHTSLLRGPAWDAHLPGIHARVAQEFKSNCRRCGGFLLLVQTPEWEFLTAVQGEGKRCEIGPTTPRSLPMPPTGP